MDLPEGYHSVAVASIDCVGFNEDTREGIIWFTSSEGLRVCMIADLAQLSQAVATIAGSQTPTEAKRTLRLVNCGKL